MILVTGASGNVGRAVVEQLVTAGEPVRALSRHRERTTWSAGVETVAGDLRDGVPAEAFAGVRALHLFPVPDRIGEVLAQAEAAGVRHVAVLSSLSMATPTDTPLRRRHADVEQAVAASSMSWTYLRPGMFMTNTLAWADLIRTAGVVRQPYPDATAAPIHEADIAGVAVAALLDPERHAGTAYSLSGPESLSQQDRVTILARVTGRDVRFEELSRDEAKAEMLASPWMNDRMVEAVLDMMGASTGRHDDLVLPGVETVLGRPGRTFAEWVADHRSAFV